MKEKSHTCEEGGAHLIISIWHLLMNFEKPKNQNFEKMKKNCWGHHHFTHLYQKPQSYEVQFLRYKEWKNENFKKIKNVPGDIIILHNCTKNNDHRLYCSWDMARDRCNCYFSFWAIFCPFTLLKAQKIKFLKKWKNTRRYHNFRQVYQKLWLDDIRFLRYGAWQTEGQTDGQKSEI